MKVKVDSIGFIVLALGVSANAPAQILYTQQTNSISAGALATDDTGTLFSDGHSDSKSNLLPYNNSVGATISSDPFFAFPLAQAQTTLGATTLTISGHTDANVNTNDVSSYSNPLLQASASASTTLQFKVSADITLFVTASVTYQENPNGSFQMLDNGVQVLSTDPFSPAISQNYLFKAGDTYEIDGNADASASTSNSSDFQAASTDYNASVSTVPEPLPTAALGLGLAVLASRSRRRG